VTKTKGFTNRTVKDTIAADTMELTTNGFVLKANIGCGVVTVWRITFCGNKEWHSCSIAGNLKDWPEQGTYEGECWLPNAANAEHCTFATFVKSAWVLYSALTHAGPDGSTKYADVIPGAGMNHCELPRLVNEGFKCLRSTKQSSVLSCPSFLVCQF
jgi:hypothetical protein